MSASRIPMFLAFIITNAFFLSSAHSFGQDADCDYLGRHFRKDLVPGSVYTAGGSIVIHVRNVGAQDFDNGDGSLFSFKVGSATYQAKKRLRIPAGKTEEIVVPQYRFRGGVIEHCHYYTVHLDYERKLGQWGCSVFNNDRRRLLVIDPSAPGWSCPL